MAIRISKQDSALIKKIAQRAHANQECEEIPYGFLEVEEALRAAHRQVPIRLQDLLNTCCSDFPHDVNNICRNYNRLTGHVYYMPQHSLPKWGNYGD